MLFLTIAEYFRNYVATVKPLPCFCQVAVNSMAMECPIKLGKLWKSMSSNYMEFYGIIQPCAIYIRTSI